MSFIKRYSLAVVCAFVALIGAVVGVLGLTVLAPAQQVQASVETDDPYVMTRQGVLGLYGDSVTVTAEAQSGQTAWVALGTATDVQSWLEGLEYTEIIGVKNTLTDLEVEESVQSGGSAATTDDVTGEQDATESDDEATESDAEAQLVNPISSDMWTMFKYGTSTASVVLSDEDLDRALIFATDGESPAPKITLTWDTPTPYYMALSGFLVAIAFAFSSFASFFTVLAVRRRRAETAKKLEILDQAVSTDTTIIPVVDGLKLLEAPQPKDRVDVALEGRTLPGAPMDNEPWQELGVSQELTDLQRHIQGAMANSFVEPNTGNLSASQARKVAPGVQTENEDSGSDYVQKSAKEFVPGFVQPEATANFVSSEWPTPESLSTGPATAAFESPVSAAGSSVSRPVNQPRNRNHPATPVGRFTPPDGVPQAGVKNRPVGQALEVSQPGSNVETLSTDSAMLNTIALQSGMHIPSRRAMREAEKRGVSALMVGGHKFSMTNKDLQDTDEDDDD